MRALLKSISSRKDLPVEWMMAMTGTVPMRSEPAHRAEMTNQLLFGDRVRVLDASGDFLLVQTAHENYEGWCQKSQVLALPEALVQFPPSPGCMAADWVQLVLVNGDKMWVPMGADMALFSQDILQLGPYRFENKGKLVVPNEKDFTPENIRSMVSNYLNAPYLWGGRSVFGIDCSGFTQQIFRFLGHRLPRDAYQQAEKGEDLGFLAEARCGDLAFFDNAAGKITHVGIMLGPDSIVHASGKVRIDPIDQQGIVHAQTGERTHQLRFVRRMVQ